MKQSLGHQDFQRVFAELRQRIANAKARSAAVVADAQAIRDQVLRARARRRGLPWSPEPFENFVKDRSNHTH